ncbi:MAG: hypothetical protein WC848_02885 [Parcubacteria group bacterium]
MPEKELELNVNYTELVSDMRQEFLRRGFLKPVKPEVFLEEKLNVQMKILAERVSSRMVRDWDKLFPGVVRSNEILRRKVEEHLAEKKQEVLEQFKSELERKAKIRQVLGFMFRPAQLNLIMVLLVSGVFMYPACFLMFFSPSDANLLWGAVGAVFTALLDGIFFLMYLFARKKESRQLWSS